MGISVRWGNGDRVNLFNYIFRIVLVCLSAAIPFCQGAACSFFLLQMYIVDVPPIWLVSVAVG